MGEVIALPMDTAPRDGTMVRLLVEFAEHATEDCVGPAWTIGANNDDNVGDDERVGWQFAGWCWTHDHFTEGRGTPVGWLPMTTAADQVQAREARDGYYLASFKRSHDRGYVIWWMPDNAGYTTDLEQAGIYAEPVLGYHDSDDTVPVPVALIESLRVRRMIDVGDSANRSLWTAQELRQLIATWAKERSHA